MHQLVCTKLLRSNFVFLKKKLIWENIFLKFDVSILTETEKINFIDKLKIVKNETNTK